MGDIVRLELIDLDPSILEGLIDALCALHLVLTFTLLLASSTFQTIQLARTLLCFTGLTATNFANEGREQCHGDHLVTVRAFEHV